MLRLDLRGSAYEIGRQHGQAAKEIIRDRFKVWCRFSADEKRIDAALGNLMDYLKNACPAIVAEMRGMADGAGITAREAQLYNLFSAVGYILQHGCSNVVFRNSDLGPILGKNTDLGMNDSDYLEMKRVYPAEGYAFVAYSYAGTTWAQGLNERGLATGGSSVHPKVKNASATGLSDCILTRLVLQHCATVDEALAFLARHPHVGKGMNFIVMDGTGDAAVVEAAPGHQVAHRIQGDTLFCTNFYVSGKIEMHPETQYLANARARYEIFRRELSGSPALTFDSMKSLLRRHEEPVSVCQHIKDGFNSVLSYIAVPREKALWFTDGHPCEREYERLAL